MRLPIPFHLLLGMLVIGVCPTLAQDVFPLKPSEVEAGEGAPLVADGDPEEGGRPIARHVIARGDHLNKIAASAYGRAGYWRLLKLYNACEPSKLKVGQVIEAPELAWWLEAEGITPLFKDAADALLEARALFMDAEDLFRAEGEGHGRGLDEEIVSKITAAQARLTQARELFAAKREGVEGLPNSTLFQLRTAVELMGEVSKEPRKAKKQMAEVHERLGNALTYCIIWARDGFK